MRGGGGVPVMRLVVVVVDGRVWGPGSDPFKPGHNLQNRVFVPGV